MRRAAVAFALVTASASCSLGPRQIVCAAPLAPALLETLHFGTNMPDGAAVTAETWQTFLSEVVTPRFPSGFTTWEASGQWRNTAGTIERERTYVLQVIHPPSDDVAQPLARIVEEYRRRFRQEAVLHTHAPTCMALR